MDIFNLLFDKTVIFFIANSLFVISYIVTNMMWLRILAVIASLSTLPYFYFQPEPLWSAVFWQLTYFMVNFINLVIIWYSMRKRSFTEVQQKMHEKYFSDLKDYEVDPIFKAAEVEMPETGKTILKCGDINSLLMLIIEGSCNVILPDGKAIKLGDGKFVGEMSFLSNEPVSADIVANEGCILYVWKQESLKALFTKHALYKPYIYSLCSTDMAEKIRQMSFSKT